MERAPGLQTLPQERALGVFVERALGLLRVALARELRLQAREQAVPVVPAGVQAAAVAQAREPWPVAPERELRLLAERAQGPRVEWALVL